MPNWKKLITSGSNISQLNNDSNFISSFTNTQNQYSTSVVSSSGIKLRLSGTGHNGNTTDDIKFAAGSNVSIVRTDASTITISSTDTNTDTVDMGDGFKVANSSGDDQFTVTENEEIRFAGSGATSVSFDSSTQKVTITSTDTNTQATRATLGIDTNDDVTFAAVNADEVNTISGGDINAGGDVFAGSTSRSANSVVRATSGDSYKAGFEAYGNSQGTGYLYVGQSSTYGGGVVYNGDGSPAFAGGETADAITFFRRSNGTDTEVFHYMYNADTVNFNGDIVAYHSSDKRLKTNILPIESALDKIDKLGGYTFDWIPTEEVHSNEGTDIGVIAQEIEEQFPELVTTRENGYKAVKYDKLVAVLLQGIKELRQEIRDCKASK